MAAVRNAGIQVQPWPVFFCQPFQCNNLGFNFRGCDRPPVSFLCASQTSTQPCQALWRTMETTRDNRFRALLAFVCQRNQNALHRRTANVLKDQLFSSCFPDIFFTLLYMLYILQDKKNKSFFLLVSKGSSRTTSPDKVIFQ